MNQSPELDKLAAALAAFQGEVRAIPKGDFNPFFKSKYAGLPDVIAAASPIAAKYGLSVCQTLGTTETSDGLVDTLTTMLLHESGQFITNMARLHLSKEDSQGHGSAVTYMRRYAYMAVLGLVADEDDDGNAASQAKTVRGHTYNETKATTRRPSPAQAVRNAHPEVDMVVTEISPKRRLLAACGGDTELANRLWSDALNGMNPREPMNETELQLLLSRAAAEVKRA